MGGDACNRMLFVTSGWFIYTFKKPHEPVVQQDRLEKRDWLSEAALWVEWENKGTLTAGTMSSLLSLEVKSFINVVTLFRDARARMALYARTFLELLHRGDPSDVMESAVAYVNFSGAPEEEGARPGSAFSLL